jgi:6-phospho-beta-glucosidase
LTGEAPTGATGPARLILNVRNGGTVPALAPDAVIETVCQVDADGALPLPAPPPSDHELGLMSTVKSCERAIISAAMTGSAADALRAFALHPLVGSLEAARILSDAARAGAAATAAGL